MTSDTPIAAALDRAAMTAAPPTAPPSTRDAEQACVDAYSAFLAARRRWHDAERLHAHLIQAGRS